MDSREKLDYIANNYTKLMHHEAYMILKDYHYAEDACQDAFINLIRVIDRIDDVTSASARAYCIKTVKNCAIDIIRKNNKTVPVAEVFEEDDDVRAVYDHYPSDTVDMVNDIEQLPEKYRNIIRMRCLEDKSAEQTARELGTNVNTVNTQLMRARKILREKWASIAAIAVCFIALIGGFLLFGNKPKQQVYYEAQTYEEIIAEESVAEENLNEATVQDGIVSQTGEITAAAAAAGTIAGKEMIDETIPQEIIEKALSEVEGSSKEDLVSSEQIETDKGITYRIEIIYQGNFHTIELDENINVISHIIEKQTDQ